MTKPLISPKRANTILYCQQWTETVHFYKQLGFLITFENDWFVEFQLTDTSFLSIANSARATISAVEGQGVTLTWEVMDVEKTQAHLETVGIATTPIQRKWGALSCYCHDPEGHRLEFWANENGSEESAE